MDREAALDRMRAGLFRFLDHQWVDTGKYSEKITVFWIDKIDEKLNELGSDVSLVEKCNAILATDFTDRNLDQPANSHTSISSWSRGVACEVLIARSVAAVS